MSLKLIVDSLDSVAEEFHGLYEEHEGKFRLAVEGIEDTTALKNAKNHEKQNRQAAEQQARELKEKLDALEAQVNASKDEDAKKKGDVDALEASWKEKLTKREAEMQSQIDGLNSNLRGLLVDKEAAALANSLAVEGSAELLTPHIKSRLGVAEKDGQFVTVVNDVEGKPSALTLDELKQEFINNAAFAPVIVGSKASGGGAGGGKGGGTATNPFVKGDGFNLTEQARLMRENPQLAAQLKSQAS